MCTRLLLDHKILVDYFHVPHLSKHLQLSFFLSHVHSDHLQGLGPTWKRGPLYCSKRSSELLMAKFGPSATVNHHVHPLPEFTWIPLNGFKVALLPANHCQGSSMFLIDLTHTVILHTGDYIFNTNYLKWKLWPKKVNWLMLDTTYHNPNWILPTYEDSIHTLEAVVRTLTGPIRIHIHTLGVESFLLDWASRYHRPLHVDIHEPMLREAIGNNASETGALITITDRTREKHKGVTVIRPCCQWFLLHKIQKPFVYDTITGLHRVWFTQHASYKQNQKLIQFLKPDVISSCVVNAL